MDNKLIAMVGDWAKCMNTGQRMSFVKILIVQRILNRSVKIFTLYLQINLLLQGQISELFLPIKGR